MVLIQVQLLLDINGTTLTLNQYNTITSGTTLTFIKNDLTPGSFILERGLPASYTQPTEIDGKSYAEWIKLFDSEKYLIEKSIKISKTTTATATVNGTVNIVIL